MGCEIAHTKCEGHHHHHCTTEHGTHHDHTPTQEKVSAISTKALEPKKGTESQQNKKQNSAFRILEGAALLAVAGAASFIFFHIYKQGSLSFTSYQAPFETTSLNPVTSGSLTFKPHHVATALFVESLFFLKQSRRSATLQDFVSLAKNSPAIASRYIHEWKQGTSELARSLVCAKNNGVTNDEQDKIALYAAHKIAPDYSKEDLVEHAWKCRNLEEIQKTQFTDNAKQFLNVLDQYQKVEQSLQKHDPLTARVLANAIDQEPVSYKRAPSLQQVAHANIDKKYQILAQRTDGLSLFEESLTTFLANPKSLANGKLSPEMSLLLLQDLIKFREAAFTYAHFNKDAGKQDYWIEKFKKIIEKSNLTEEQTVQWFSLISSKGENYTPWLIPLLEKATVHKELLKQLQPSQEVPSSLRTTHKILAVNKYVLELASAMNKESFDFLLSQIDEILKDPELSIENKDLLSGVLYNFITLYQSSESSQFLSSTVYTPPKHISRSCLELVHNLFSCRKIDVSNAILPFPVERTWASSWSIPIERRINIELYKESIPPAKATELIKKVMAHKASENWNLRFPYIKEIIEKVSHPRAEQLAEWCLLVLSHDDKSQVDDLLNAVLPKISTITSDKATQLIQKMIEKNSSILLIQTLINAATSPTQKHVMSWIHSLLSNPTLIETGKTIISDLLDAKLLPNLSGISSDQAEELLNLIINLPITDFRLQTAFQAIKNPQLSDFKNVALSLLVQTTDSSNEDLLKKVLHAAWKNPPEDNLSKLKIVLSWTPTNEKFRTLVMNYFLEKKDLMLSRYTLAAHLMDIYPNWKALPNMIVDSYIHQAETFKEGHISTLTGLQPSSRSQLANAFHAKGLTDIARQIRSSRSSPNEGRIV